MIDEKCPYRDLIEVDEFFECPVCSNEGCDYYIDPNCEGD